MVDRATWLGVASLEALPRYCPRCRGRMLLQDDSYSAYSSCLACGCVVESGKAPEPDDEPDAEHRGRPRLRHRPPSHHRSRL